MILQSTSGTLLKVNFKSRHQKSTFDLYDGAGEAMADEDGYNLGLENNVSTGQDREGNNVRTKKSCYVMHDAFFVEVTNQKTGRQVYAGPITANSAP